MVLLLYKKEYEKCIEKVDNEKMKEALGAVTTVADDPTLGAGMNMDQLMDKLMAQDQANKELKKVIKIKKCDKKMFRKD